MIQRIDLRSLDPLRLLSHESLFPDRKEKEGEEKEKDEREEDERLLKIWQCLLTEIEEEPSTRKIVLRGPILLKELARRLNSSTLQDRIKEKIFLSQHGPKSVQSEAPLLIKNLEKLNEKIDRANEVWFRKIPLVSRVFSFIDRIQIPKG